MVNFTKLLFWPVIVILLGTVVSIFFFTNKLVTQFETPFNQDDVNLLLEKLLQEKANLENEITTLKEQHESLAETIINQSDRERINDLNSKLDLTEINGPGVSITLAPQRNEIITDGICLATYLRDIRNILNLKELELKGLSINNQRLGYNSVINCIGNGLIIDNKRVIAPFEIEIIGNGEKIANTITTRKFLPSLWNDIDNGIIVLNYKIKPKVSLKAFAGNIRFEYLRKNNDR